MMVSQTLAILSGIFALALASAQSTESCSGESCSDELSAWSSLLQTTIARQDKAEHKNNESVYESEATVHYKRAIDANFILREHNIARCMHGADPLVWHDGMASHGKSWADKIHYSGMKHGDMDFDDMHVGQNLAGSCSSPDFPDSDKTAVSQWMEEESYNGGHYTQLVWKGSKQVGCGMWCGPDLGMNCCMVACNYYPAGNNGEDASNVEVRVKTRSQCESDIGDGGSTPASPAPPPAGGGGGCEDSATYKDPDGYKCHEWEGYPCSGHWFSEELQASCPKVCGTCGGGGGDGGDGGGGGSGSSGQCLYADPNWTCQGSNCVPKDKYQFYTAAGGKWCLTSDSSYCQKTDAGWCNGECACPGNCPHACGRCPA